MHTAMIDSVWVSSSFVIPNTRCTTWRSAASAMNISCSCVWSIPVMTLPSIDTSAFGTFWRANISNSWYMSAAPISCATLWGTGIANTEVAPYVAADAFTGYGIQKSVSPRRNFASAVLMSVCGATLKFSPVRSPSSASRSPTKPITLPDSSVSGYGHGEKSIVTGLRFFSLRVSHWLSSMDSAAMSLRLP